MPRFNLLQWLDLRGQKIPLQLLLSVPFFLLTIGATGLVGYFSYRSGQQAVQDLARQLMQETGDHTDLYLQQLLQLPPQVNQLTADAIRTGYLTGLESPHSSRLEAHLRQQLNRFPAVRRMAIAHHRGGLVIAGHLADGQIKVQHTTQGSQDPTHSLIRFKATAGAGKPIWSPLYSLPNAAGLALSAGLPVSIGGERGKRLLPQRSL